MSPPVRASYPQLGPGDRLVMVSRDQILVNSRPVVYVQALAAATYRIDSRAALGDQPTIQVFNWAAGAGDNVQVFVDGVGTTITEGVDFGAAVSNDQTAFNMAAAIRTNVANLASVEVNGAFIVLVPAAGVELIQLTSSDLTAYLVSGFTIQGPVHSVPRGMVVASDLPEGAVFDGANKVSVLNVLTGRVAADIRAADPVRTYLEQPYTLAGNTGHAGGWPTSPDPV